MTDHVPHPTLRLPEDHDIEAPVRDDAALGATEDLDREPDGAPHRVIGWTALVAVVLAMVLLLLLATDRPGATVTAVVVLVVATPVAVLALRAKAAAQRDRRHPSR